MCSVILCIFQPYVSGPHFESPPGPQRKSWWERFPSPSYRLKASWLCSSTIQGSSLMFEVTAAKCAAPRYLAYNEPPKYQKVTMASPSHGNCGSNFFLHLWNLRVFHYFELNALKKLVIVYPSFFSISSSKGTFILFAFSILKTYLHFLHNISTLTY